MPGGKPANKREARSRSREPKPVYLQTTLLTFKPQRGRAFNVPFFMHEKVGDVKEELHARLPNRCPPAEHQLLVHKGAVVGDDEMLSDAVDGFRPIYMHWDEDAEDIFGGLGING